MRVRHFAAILAVLLLAEGDVVAQTVQLPAFPVADGSLLDVAADYGGMHFVTSESGVSLRRFTLQGVANGSVAIGQQSQTEIAADGRGGLTVVGMEMDEVVGRYFDNAGNAQGVPFQLSRDDGFSNGPPRLAGLPTGAVITWSESILGLGLPLFVGAASQATEIGSSPLTWDVASRPSGGFVVGWTYYTGNSSGMKAQVFGGLGMPLGSAFDVDVPDPFPAGSGFTLSRVAASPVGAVSAAVGLLPGVGSDREIVAYRFSDSGTLLGTIAVAHTTVPSAGAALAAEPDAGFDFAGNLYVVWGDAAAANAGVHVRGFDPTGDPLGPSLRVATEVSAERVRTALLPNGSFVNAWTTNDGARANVVTLCAPGSAVCGDGILVPACERCDDGAGNQDAVPDACRSDCVPAHCGDGTVDAGEQCDDGNLDACDGCDAFCSVETGIDCGDGVVAPVCGEQCDDGNTVALDGCSPACRLERIPGGGKASTDCLCEWSIDNRANVPAFDKRGFINSKQRCVDGDSRCDFGGTPGSCTFHVRVCGNNTDVPGCRAPSRLSSWTVERPSVKDASKRPEMAMLRADLIPAVPAAIVGSTERDVCSGVVAVTVPLRGAPELPRRSKLKLQSRATSYEGETDKDALQLECLP